MKQNEGKQVSNAQRTGKRPQTEQRRPSVVQRNIKLGLRPPTGDNMGDKELEVDEGTEFGSRKPSTKTKVPNRPVSTLTS